MAELEIINYFGSYEDAVRELREEIPPAFPVSVRRVALKNQAGDCELKEMARKGKKQKRFVIRISKFLDDQTAILVLLHEWAHALAWTWEHDTVDDHGAEWGLAYARTYCALMRVK